MASLPIDFVGGGIFADEFEGWRVRGLASSPTSLRIGIRSNEFEDALINELPDLDAAAEPDDLPDLAVQPGVVDPAGLDDTAGCANISDDDGVPHVVNKNVVEGTSVLTQSSWKSQGPADRHRCGRQ